MGGEQEGKAAVVKLGCEINEEKKQADQALGTPSWSLVQLLLQFLP